MWVRAWRHSDSCLVLKYTTYILSSAGVCVHVGVVSVCRR